MEKEHFPRPYFLNSKFFNSDVSSHVKKEVTVIINHTNYSTGLTKGLFTSLPFNCYFAISPYLPFNNKLMYRFRTELKGKILMVIPSQIVRTINSLQLKDILRNFKGKFAGFLIEDIYSFHLIKDKSKGHGLIYQEAKKREIPMFYAYPSIVHPQEKKSEIYVSDAQLDGDGDSGNKLKKVTEIITDTGSAIITIDLNKKQLTYMKDWLQKMITKFGSLAVKHKADMKGKRTSDDPEDKSNNGGGHD